MTSIRHAAGCTDHERCPERAGVTTTRVLKSALLIIGDVVTPDHVIHGGAVAIDDGRITTIRVSTSGTAS